jgi:hypothetical protein
MTIMLHRADTLLPEALHSRHTVAGHHCCRNRPLPTSKPAACEHHQVTLNMPETASLVHDIYFQQP